MNLPIPLCILEFDGSITWYNSKFNAMIGEDDLLGVNIDDLIKNLNLRKVLNENKDMYIVTTSKSAMALHKLNLPYVFIATLSEKIPIEVKSSASRIIYSTNNYEINQFSIKLKNLFL